MSIERRVRGVKDDFIEFPDEEVSAVTTTDKLTSAALRG